MLIERSGTDDRRICRLSPAGPEGRLGGPGRLARGGGVLVGSLVGERIQLWLAQRNGKLILTMWPGEYRAMLNPLVLLDDEGRVIARGGEHVNVSGGFLPADDPRLAGHDCIFFASRTVKGTRLLDEIQRR